MKRKIVVLSGSLRFWDKIQLADALYVVNVDGYIGKSTRSEIEFAKQLGKEIIYLESAKALG